MSQAVAGTEIRAERGVVARSQYATVVHRPDPDVEDPRPACHEADVEHAAVYREVAVDAVTPQYQPCQNPSCFGDGPGGKHIYVLGGVADRPVRIQAALVGIAAAMFGETPIERADVQALLAVDERRRGSLRRGLGDARDAGWLEWDSEAREYRQGPLAAALRGGERP